MKILHLSFLLITLLGLMSCNKDDDSGTTPPPEVITTTADLLDLFTGDVVGTSKLERADGFMQMEIVSNNLIPGHVYNMVCAVFNKPENCEGGPSTDNKCSPEDFQYRNQEVEAVSFLVDGKTASTTTETFTATLRERDISSYDMSIQGDHGGLQDSKKAVVYLLIKSQGPAQTGTALNNQLTTMSNACFFNNVNILDPTARVPVEVGECALIQRAEHLVP